MEKLISLTNEMIKNIDNMVIKRDASATNSYMFNCKGIRVIDDTELIIIMETMRVTMNISMKDDIKIYCSSSTRLKFDDCIGLREENRFMTTEVILLDFLPNDYIFILVKDYDSKKYSINDFGIIRILESKEI